MEIYSDILPPDVPLWAAGLTIFAAFFTAMLTAAFSLGGGLALLAIMSAILPAPAVIPVHGVAQLGSNVSRFALQARDVVWSIILWFSAGALLGSAIGGAVAVNLPVWALRGGVGFFILYAVWGPRPGNFTPGRKTFFATGAIGSFLTMFFGATGPIAATMLSATKLDRLNRTATHAACMTMQHFLKILAFGFLGFAYVEWAGIIILIVLAGFAGSFVGTKFLRKMDEQTFGNGFKTILSAVALYLIAAAISDFRTS
ncbi:MAG: sulfite exporter TauE/SafE family protein [Marinicaulis sp.]|nr:sulfite exporter TauE/SafE family protein [Marinicaulis sp.]NNE40683.1 sulfite exporter TauE/SafE family protein [Marinicaulis sp.]